MYESKFVKITSMLLLGFSALAIMMVAFMAFGNPQSVMDLVQVKLPNTDAYSSIRGVYGGVGVTIGVTLIYLLLKDRRKGLCFAALLWGGYAVSRSFTIVLEGALGAFGTQWLIIESILFVLSILLLLTGYRSSK